MNENQIRQQPVVRVDLPGNKRVGRGGSTNVIPLAPKLRSGAAASAANDEIYHRAQLHFHQGRFRKAYADFCLAAQDRRRLASSILMASRCLLHCGQSRRALSLLESGLQRDGWNEAERALLQQEVTRQLRGLQAPGSSPEPASPVEAEEQAVPPAAPEKQAATPRPEAVRPEPSPPAAEKRAPRSEARPAEIRPQVTAGVDLYAAPTSKLVTIPFGLLVIGAISYGFLQRGEGYLTAESGPGYLLGIIGSVLMIVLMLYPMRKKMRFMRNWGPVSYWFRFHMLAGIIGPVMILFHANFQLGSLNSRVVLWSTLLVAGSGVFGRYLYTKIHYGLYGKRVSLEQLHAAITSNQDNLTAVFAYAPRIQQRLLRFDEIVLRPSNGLFASIGRVLLIDLRRRWTELRIQLVLRRALRVAARRNQWSRRETARQYRAANLLIKRHFIAVLKVAEFSFYERFFSLWHVFHMPLFLLLLIALVMHVIAVHMY